MASNILDTHEKVQIWKTKSDTVDPDRDTDNGSDNEEEEEVWQQKLMSKEVVFNLSKLESLLKPTELCFSRILHVADTSKAREVTLHVRGKCIIWEYIEEKKDMPIHNFFDGAMTWAQEKHKLPAMSGDAFAMIGFQLFCATNVNAIIDNEHIKPKERKTFEIQEVTKTVLCFLKDAIQRTTGNMHIMSSIYEGLQSYSRADDLKSDYGMIFKNLPEGRRCIDPITQLLHVYRYCRPHSTTFISQAVLGIIRALKMDRWDEGTLEYILTSLLNAEGLTCVKATSIVIKQVKSGPDKDASCQMVKPDILYFGKEDSDGEDLDSEICTARLKLVLDESKTRICFPFKLKSDTLSYHQVSLKPSDTYVYADPSSTFEYTESTEAEPSSKANVGRDTKEDQFLKVRVDHLWQMSIQMYAVMMNSNTFAITEKTTKILQTGILTINKESLVVVLAMDRDVYLSLKKATSAAKTFTSLTATHLSLGRLYVLGNVFSSMDIMELSAFCHHYLCGAFDRIT